MNVFHNVRDGRHRRTRTSSTATAALNAYAPASGRRSGRAGDRSGNVSSVENSVTDEKREEKYNLIPQLFDRRLFTRT